MGVSSIHFLHWNCVDRSVDKYVSKGISWKTCKDFNQDSFVLNSNLFYKFEVPERRTPIMTSIHRNQSYGTIQKI